MHCPHHLAAVVILLASATASSFQGELVVVTESTKQYHRPSCPLVRDGKDVLAMSVGQAELRGYKAHPRCDPANANAASPAQTAARTAPGGEQPAPVFVYTAAGDTRYHRETCQNLSKERKKVRLEAAGKKLWPCSVCRPPVRKRTPAVPRR